MKKRLILGMAALAAVTFTSCQKDQVINQVPQEQAIGFTTYTGRDAQTKGTVMDVTALQNKGFGVYAYYTTTTNTLDSYNTAAIDAESAFKPNFMQNTEVSGSTWNYFPKKYWPKGNDTYKLSFLAYAPHSNGSENGITHSYSESTDNNYQYGHPLLKYTVNPVVAEHQDVLFAPLSQNKEIQKDDTDNGTVKLHFFHALSRIGFEVSTAENYSSNANITITVKKITLRGKMVTSGTMNLYLAEGTKANGGVHAVSTPGWALGTKSDTEVEYVVANSVTPNNSNYTLFSNNYIMMMPQEFAQTSSTPNLYIDVEYDVTYSTPASVTIGNKVSVDVTANNAIEFEPGYAYTFKLAIGLDAIKFDATVEDWGTEEEKSLGI